MHGSVILPPKLGPLLRPSGAVPQPECTSSTVCCMFLAPRPAFGTHHLADTPTTSSDANDWFHCEPLSSHHGPRSNVILAIDCGNILLEASSGGTVSAAPIFYPICAAFDSKHLHQSPLAGHAFILPH